MIFYVEPRTEVDADWATLLKKVKRKGRQK
jgi:hypothetical protein